MSENHFVGTWSVTKPSNLGSLQEITIEELTETGRFLITAPAARLHLPDLVYDPEEDVLIGSCEGRVGDTEGTFNVAVVQYGSSPAQCKGIVFCTAGRDREDNSVGTWTADKKGPVDPPPRRR